VTCLGSGVGEGFAGAGIIGDFAGLENFAAVEALDVLRVVIFGDQLRTFVLARGIWHKSPVRKTLELFLRL
jgi:hypothetical protein